MTPSFSFDKDALNRVSAAVYAAIDGKAVVEKIRGLKGIDWNPFDEDGDEHVGPWNEIKHNFKLVADVAMEAVMCLERANIAGEGLTDPQKHAVAVQVLDDILRLPWYLEPFDNIALDMLVSTAVAGLKGLGWVSKGISGSEKVDMTEAVMGVSLPNVKTARERISGTFREIG
jgi:hypothetical protein